MEEAERNKVVSDEGDCLIRVPCQGSITGASISVQIVEKRAVSVLALGHFLLTFYRGRQYALECP